MIFQENSLGDKIYVVKEGAVEIGKGQEQSGKMAKLARLEGGEVLLEESIDIYSRGTHLKTHCEQKLHSAREKVERIVPGDLDGVGAEPAEID